MRVLLLNAAMMPAADGTYESETITLSEFVSAVRVAHQNGTLESYVGYPQNIAPLEKACRVPIKVNRAETIINDGDVMLIARLTYRVNPSEKGRVNPTINDFEFRRVYYYANSEKR